MKQKIAITALLALAVSFSAMYKKFGPALALPYDGYSNVFTGSGLGNEATLVEAVQSYLVLGGLARASGIEASALMSLLGLVEEEKKPIDYIVLSHNEFFYKEGISVEVSFEMGGIDSYEVYYTLDGSEPSLTSMLYENAIDMPVSSKAYCLKLKAYYTIEGGEGILYETGTLAHTYFVKAGEQRFNTIVFSISTDPGNLYGYENGIFVCGKARDDFIRRNPGRDIVTSDPANYNLVGRSGERPVYVEVFEPDGNRVISQGASLKVHGDKDRHTQQKTLLLSAKKRFDPFGELGKFHYKFFPEAYSAQIYPIVSYFNSFEDLVLKNPGVNSGLSYLTNDIEADFYEIDRFPYIRGELTSRLAGLAGFPDSAYSRPASVYINGEYYGFSWLTENFNIERLQQNYQSVDSSFAVINYTETALNSTVTVTDGISQAKQDFESVMEYQYMDFTNDEVYEKFCSLVDIGNLSLFYAIQAYIGLQSNQGAWETSAWKYYGNDVTLNLDGKWRFIVSGNEKAWGYSETTVPYSGFAHDAIAGLLNGEGNMGRLFSSLSKRQDFIEKFVNAMCDLMSDSFSYGNVVLVLDELVELAHDELNYAFENLSFYPEASELLKTVNDIKKYASARALHVDSQLRKHFNIRGGGYYISVSGAEGMKVSLNTIPVNGNEQKSSYYFEGYPVSISAVETGNEYVFSHWLVNGQKVTERELVLSSDISGNMRVGIELFTQKTGIPPIIISEVYSGGMADWIKAYNNSSDTISTEGLFISDDVFMPYKWAFPVMDIPPHSDILLVCTNNKRQSSLLNIAVNFSLSSGEILSLSDSSGRAISKVRIPRMDSQKILAYDFEQKIYNIKRYSGN